MNKIDHALYEINELDDMASKKDQWLHTLHPLVKFIVTFFYIILLVSFSKYNLLGVCSMVIYPLILFELSEYSILHAMHYLRLPLVLILFLSIGNPFFDRTILIQTETITISYGMVSMLCLIIKGVLSLLATYLFIVSTSLDQICYSLSLLHIPTIMITLFLLIYRYIRVLLEEVSHTIDAYSLRAPGQKGVHWRTWGSMVGQILLRSIDRANEVYQSMCLRGFQGSFDLPDVLPPNRKDMIYLSVWGILLSVCRILPVFSLIGEIFMKGH